MAVLKLLLLYSIVEVAVCYKIFVYSAQSSHSHVSFLGQIADTLAENGHEVVVYLPAFLDNVTSTGVTKARAVVKPRTFDFDINVDNFLGQIWKNEGSNPLDLIKMRRLMGMYWARLCKSQLDDVEMIESFRKEKFDLGIGELFDQCSLAYIELLGLKKHVSTMSCGLTDHVTEPLGIESSPSFIPNIFSPFSDEMTYTERIRNIVLSVAARAIDRYVYEPPIEAVLKEKLGQHFDFKEYQKIMESAKDGVVLVSFGSVMKSSIMPTETKNALIGAFRNFPQIKFIWKYEVNDQIGNDLPNLKKVKWAPQVDLFGHKNLKAFITHGGLNSITECSHAGVPAVVVPLFADQLRNARMAQKRGFAYIVDKQNITVEALTAALSAVLNDKKYNDRAKQLQKMLANKPFKASELLVKHVEFAAEFGHIENLDSAATKLNFIQYYLLDIIIPFIILVLSFVVVCLLFCLYMLKKIFSLRKAKQE